MKCLEQWIIGWLISNFGWLIGSVGSKLYILDDISLFKMGGYLVIGKMSYFMVIILFGKIIYYMKRSILRF